MDATDEDTGERMSDVQLHDEVMTMLMAGHETTANALSWTLYLLSKYPSALRTLQCELDEQLHGAPVEVSQLKQLTYLDHTLKEALRLYPPVWALARHAIDEDELCGYHIPKDSYVRLVRTAFTVIQTIGKIPKASIHNAGHDRAKSYGPNAVARSMLTFHSRRGPASALAIILHSWRPSSCWLHYCHWSSRSWCPIIGWCRNRVLHCGRVTVSS